MTRYGLINNILIDHQQLWSSAPEVAVFYPQANLRHTSCPNSRDCEMKGLNELTDYATRLVLTKLEALECGRHTLFSLDLRSPCLCRRIYLCAGYVHNATKWIWSKSSYERLYSFSSPSHKASSFPRLFKQRTFLCERIHDLLWASMPTSSSKF